MIRKEFFMKRADGINLYLTYSDENKYIMQVWDKVESLLFEADHWCFIGYSLPEADRYFTYLLTKIYNFRK